MKVTVYWAFVLLSCLLAFQEAAGAEEMKLRWGILSAGRISWDFIKSMQNFDKKHHEIVAIGSRNKTRGDYYAKTFKIPTVYNNYVDLAKDPNIDVVYIATINSLHFAAVKLMLENGKHVLCEKPLVVKPEDAKELFALAKERNLFLMEALWSKFLPPYTKAMQLIDSGEIGQLELIQANFLLSMPDVDRLKHLKYGGGIVLDIGTYTWNAVLLPLNYTRPTEVKAVGRLHKGGPDRTVAISARFPNDVIASIAISSKVSANSREASNHVLYMGSKGYIKFPNPINSPTEIEVNGKKISTEFRDQQKDYNYPNSAGLRFQAEEVRQQLMKKKLTSEVMPPEHSILISELTADVHKQLGIEFPETERGYDFKEITPN